MDIDRKKQQRRVVAVENNAACHGFRGKLSAWVWDPSQAKLAGKQLAKFADIRRRYASFTCKVE